MVTQNKLRTYIGLFRFETDLDLIKGLKDIKWQRLLLRAHLFLSRI